MLALRPVEFLGNSLSQLRRFPAVARRVAGFQLDRIQRGLNPLDWKPMPAIGPGVHEIRVRDEAGAFRVIYSAKSGETVLVLHCFQKKTPRTSKGDIALARSRFRRFIAARSKK